MAARGLRVHERFLNRAPQTPLPTITEMTHNKAGEDTRKQWMDMNRKEKALIRLCDDMQREVLAFHAKAKYWRNEYAFLETCGRSPQNLARMEQAVDAQAPWLDRATSRFHNLGHQTNKLKAITAARKKLQEQLGIDPTEDGYVAYRNEGDGVELGKRFVLLDHELDSTTSVRHYIEENMGGSSLFADEEWPPPLR